MFMYFGKTHYSTSYGVQLENVTCDRCNCEYQYELARYGLGISHSHYGLGESNANHKAHGRSSENLNERLAFDAELVPCPKCQWVNEALVERYRHGHFKSLVMNVIEFAAVTLLLVFAVCLPIHAWVAEYAQLAGIILIMTSVGCVLAVIASVLIRRALQARVDPNKLYPARPRLPVGTPPALLVNRDTGVLEPIDHAHAANEHVGHWNLFQLGRHEFPNRCCKCHSGLDVTRKHRLSFRGFILDLPICVRCDRKTKVTKIVSAVMIVCILMAVVVLILPTFALSELGYLTAITLSFACSAIVAALLVDPIVSPARGKVADRYRGVLWLKFRRPKYAVVTHFCSASPDTEWRSANPQAGSSNWGHPN